MSAAAQESVTCVVTAVGTRVWTNDAKQRHRVDGPAVIFADGSEEWWYEGLLHRDGKPAKTHPNGDCVWYTHGKLHCTSGPAIVSLITEWWVNGKLHRLNGPAIEYPDGRRSWYANDLHFTEEEFYRYVDQITGEVFVPPGRYLTYERCKDYC